MSDQKKELVISFDEAMKFKKLIAGTASCTIQYFDKKGNAKIIQGTLTKLKKRLIKLNKNGADVALMINESDGKGRSTENVVRVRALFVDIDNPVQDVNKLIVGLPKPHAIVESSSQRFHIYWKTERCPLEQFSRVQRALAQRMGGDRSVSDLPRAMRMPGFINHKRGDVARLVKVRELDPHPFSKLAEGFGFDPTQGEAQAEGADNDEPPSLDVLSAALKLIPAEARTQWRDVGMGIKSAYPGEQGLKLFIEWSMTSSKFELEEARRQWNSWSPDGRRTWRTILYLARIYQGEDDALPTNELELATQLEGILEARAVYDEARGSWMFWDDEIKQWCVGDHHVLRELKEVLPKLLLRAKGAGAAREYLKGCQKMSVMSGVMKAVALAPAMCVPGGKVDPDPRLLGVVNGVVDLRTGVFREARPSDLVTMQSGVPYDSAASSPRWEAFVLEIMNNSEDAVKYLQRAAGYFATGLVVEHVLHLLLGGGRNGKGVFARLLHHVLGGYAQWMDSKLLLPKSFNTVGAAPEIARMEGRRLLIASEVPKNTSFDSAFIKAVTGEDFLTARGMYDRTLREFQPVGKILLMTNAMPRISHDDRALWNRVVIVPFDVTFTGNKRDKGLEEALKKEAAGILNWIIEGAVMYSKKGLKAPEQFRLARKEAKHRADSVGLWLKERCIDSQGEKLPSSNANKDFNLWAKQQHYDNLNAREFSEAMEKKGIVKKKRAGGMMFLDLKLAS